mmetsp:Transcript_18052/g.23439  ORF Transcript_18052/g.23439 Transcript_18052/m.23439 type:complete len:673 (-) Transcript_18052:21-2039(-)
MSDKPIIKFDLSCDLSITWKKLWRDDSFYLDYLREQDDIDIVIGSWSMEGNSSNSLTRQVECSHPVKVSFPGTPSHTRCFRRQTITLSNKNTTLIMNELMRFEGIPYSDYFTVKTKWSINEQTPSLNNNSRDTESGEDMIKICEVSIYVQVEFQKSTWLKGTISSNTESEAKEGLDLWNTKATQYLLTNNFNKSTNQSQSLDIDGIPNWFSPCSTISPKPSSQSLQGMNIGELSRSSSKSSSIGGFDGRDGWDSDQEFFDVEFTRDSDAGVNLLDHSSHSQNSYSSPYSSHHHGYHPSSSSSHISNNHNEGRRNQRKQNLHFDEDQNISTMKVLREALSVVIQFAWWRIRSASMDTWGPLFAPDPSTVVKRLIKTLAPITLKSVDFDCRSGSEIDERDGTSNTSLAILTSNPDLFVPSLLVLSLAQVLLWCIDVTGKVGHVHCRRETLLGTVLLVSSSTWLGASLWYHLVSYLLGSRLEVIQSFTVVGYGLIGTCVSLVASQLLVLLQRELSHSPAKWASLNPEWGLFAFGIPSGVALAIVFSQSTPIRKKSRKSSSSSSSSSSHFINERNEQDEENENNIRNHIEPVRRVRAVARKTKQTAAWCWPKALCFLVVLVTHLELLRYIHHVVIPGEQKLCAMWSNMLPEDIARFDYYEIQKLAHTIKEKAPFKV